MRDEWRSWPHPARLSPANPWYSSILAAHEQALAAGEALYRDPESGLYVLTAQYLADRGTCCTRGCRHCPYVAEASVEEEDTAEG